MTDEQIIEMARKAGLHGLVEGGIINEFKAFAELVAEHELEACAVIAETPIRGEQDDITMEAKDRVAKAIRARGEA